MLDVKKLLTKILNTIKTDYIVEEGTSGSWTYRKWNSGIAECWGVANLSTTISSTWGSAYLSPAQTTQYPSGLFIAVPCVQLTNASYYIAIPLGSTHTKDAISYQLFRGASVSSSQTYSVQIYAKGKWK